MAASKLVTLSSSDGKLFEVNEAVAFESLFIKELIEETGMSRPNPFNIPSEILTKVIEFCEYHVESQKTSNDKPATSEDEIKAWVAGFTKAAGYLNIKNLLDECGRSVAYMIKGKTVEQIRKIMNITCDFTPEEEEENRRENAWAFEI